MWTLPEIKIERHPKYTNSISILYLQGCDIIDIVKLMSNYVIGRWTSAWDIEIKVGYLNILASVVWSSTHIKGGSP